MVLVSTAIAFWATEVVKRAGMKNVSRDNLNYYNAHSLVQTAPNWPYNYNGNLAEWLRRKIRNLLGSARAGSNPAVVVFIFFGFLIRKIS